MIGGWKEPPRRPVAEAEAEGIHLHPEGPRSVGWWGLMLTLLFDTMLFVALVFGFLLLWSQNDAWPPANLAAPDWLHGGIGLALLAASVLPLALAWWSMRRRRAGLLAMGLMASALLGTAWGVMSWQALGGAGFAPRQLSFNAMLAALFAFQLLHVAIGVLLLLFGAIRALVAGFAAGMHRLMRIVAVFWLYATIITLASAALVRLLPDWGPG